MAGQTISTAVSGRVYLAATNNPLTITSSGSVTTTASNDAISGGSGTPWAISNFGTISGIIGSSSAGIYLQGTGSSVQNSGTIYGNTAGIWFSSGGSVTNNSGGLISGTGNYGVYIGGAAGVVTNYGTITGGAYAVYLAFSSASNRVVVAPGAVFNGLVSGGNGTLEFASGFGSGSISGLNTGSYQKFAALVVDAGASWTLSGSNTIASVTDDGSLIVAGALPAANYQIGVAGGGGILEVASAPANASPINFLGSSTLIIDSAATFGANVGAANYAGPLLESFGAGDTVDIKNFSAANASLIYNSTTGLLQIADGSQTASLDFQTSTLGSGTFNLASDGGTGLLLTNSQTAAPAAPTITSPANGSTDTTTATPTISGGGVTGDTVTVSIDGTVVGTPQVVAGAWTFTPTSALSNASHTITATQAAPGGPSSTVASDTFTVNVSGGGLTISSAVIGPLSLKATNNPLTITGAGSVKATASGADAIDGGSGVAWSINNSGTVASSQRYAISLHGAGSSILNSGSISGDGGEGGYGVDLEAGGTVTNTGTGYVSGGEDAIFGAGAAVNINNSGQIISTFDDGVGLFGGGSVINNAGAVIQAPTGGGFGPAGVYIPSGSANVVNHGSITGQYGVYLGVAGRVENAGTISGSSSAVTFAVSSSANRLIVDPGAVFNGSVKGNGGVLELAAGTGSIGLIGSSAFSNFTTLTDDAGGDWTLTGSNAIANVVDNGALTINGSLNVTSALNAASTGSFDLGAGGVLEVASATGAQTEMDFLGASRLVVDNAALFGTGIGGSSYLGSQLEDFGAGDSIDLHNFSASGATLAYNSSSGLLQLSNGGALATLDFQQSTLGGGSFHLAADASGSGLLITRV
jgi:Bacterial Ig-like domain